jgi:RNA polymerase sigma-70 factor (ECF subfamily)
MIEGMSFPLVICDMGLTGSREEDRARTLMSEDEFCAFYERTARPLWAYLSRITGDAARAEDYLQEAYYRFYRAGAKHESESHRRNSLFQIATNVVRDHARRSRLYEEVPLAEDWSSDPAQRQLLWLAYAQGSSHEEIAAILGLRAISVRTLLFRARQRLATLLKGSTR